MNDLPSRGSAATGRGGDATAPVEPGEPREVGQPKVGGPPKVGEPPKRGPYVPIPVVRRTEQVRDQLEAAIERGDYAPGDRLPSERELVELLGVSRVSVREALRALEAIGLLEVRHGSGCFVAGRPSDRYATSFSRWIAVHGEQALELLKVRGALDELAAEMAARDGADTWPATLRDLNRSFRSTDPGRIELLAARDVAFHEAIGDASASPLLAMLLRRLHATFAESRQAMLHPPGRAAESALEHDAIVDAIERRDPEGARRATAAHLRSVREALAGPEARLGRQPPIEAR